MRGQALGTTGFASINPILLSFDEHGRFGFGILPAGSPSVRKIRWGGIGSRITDQALSEFEVTE